MGRPLSGKSAPKGRMSLIDRVSGGLYTPPTPQPIAMPRQLESTSAPEKNNEVKPAVKAVAAPEQAPMSDSEATEIEAYKKKMESDRAERDIKAYAQRKAQKEAASKLKKK